MIQESARNPLPVSGFFLFPAVEADVLICKLVSFHKEQNPPDQLRDIDRGGDVVVHTLMPVFIFRGKVVVLGEDKERQKPDRGILHLEHPSHPPQRMKQLHCCAVRQFQIAQDQFNFLILKNPALGLPNRGNQNQVKALLQHSSPQHFGAGIFRTMPKSA